MSVGEQAQTFKNHLNDFRNKLEILQIVKHYLKVKPSGANYLSLCPFHSDSNPSLTISTTKNIFRCFSCGKSGDAITFVMAIDNCQFQAAIKKISHICSIPLPKFINLKNEKYFSINHTIMDVFHRSLIGKGGERCMKFLQTRGIDLEQIKTFKLGYAPKHDIMTAPALQQGILENDLWNNKLIGFNKEGQSYPLFVDRLIFPIFNLQNKVAGFSGRDISTSSNANVNIKYLNSKDHEIFKKNSLLYNANNLKENQPIYIFEGFFDVIRAHKLGFSNSIALMGLTYSQNNFKSREIILSLDNDSAGQQFTEQIFSIFLKSDCTIKVVNLKTAKDIDELACTNPTAATSLLHEPINFYEWKFQFLLEQGLDRNVLINQINQFLALLFDKKGLIKGINHEFATASLDEIFNLYAHLNDESLIRKSQIIKQKYSDMLLKNLMDPTRMDNDCVWELESPMPILNHDVWIETGKDILAFLQKHYKSISKTISLIPCSLPKITHNSTPLTDLHNEIIDLLFPKQIGDGKSVHMHFFSDLLPWLKGVYGQEIDNLDWKDTDNQEQYLVIKNSLIFSMKTVEKIGNNLFAMYHKIV